MPKHTETQASPPKLRIRKSILKITNPPVILEKLQKELEERLQVMEEVDARNERLELAIQESTARDTEIGEQLAEQKKKIIVLNEDYRKLLQQEAIKAMNKVNESLGIFDMFTKIPDDMTDTKTTGTLSINDDFNKNYKPSHLKNCIVTDPVFPPSTTD